MPRDRAAREPIMTGETLSELCNQAKVIKGDMTPPSTAAWRRLAAYINVGRRDHMDPGASRRRLLQILTEVDQITDELLEELRMESFAPVNLLADNKYYVGGAVAVVKQLTDAINEVRSHLFFQADKPLVEQRNRKRAKWPGYADILASFFVEAMKETNPDIEIRLGDDGPVSRFLAAVIPSITGERPKPAAIARHLQRAQGR